MNARVTKICAGWSALLILSGCNIYNTKSVVSDSSGFRSWKPTVEMEPRVSNSKSINLADEAQVAPPESNEDALKGETQTGSAGVVDPGNLDFGKYHALLIGINKYKSLSNLTNAIPDVREVSSVLRTLYGFRVKELVDPTRTQIIEALDRLRKELGPKDNLLLYFAGHGVLDKETGRGYWLPVDATKDSTANWIPTTTITDAAKAIKAKHILVVSDSCYSGAMTRSVDIRGNDPDYLKRIVDKKSRTVLSSGGLEPVMDSDGVSKNSVFATAFISALRRNKSIMDGTQLFSIIRRPVVVNAPQTPEYSDMRFAGHDGGDFLFVRR